MIPNVFRKLDSKSNFRKQKAYKSSKKDQGSILSVKEGMESCSVRSTEVRRNWEQAEGRLYHRSHVPPSYGTAARWVAPAHAGCSPRSCLCASFGWHLGERAAGTRACGLHLVRRACWCPALEETWEQKTAGLAHPSEPSLWISVIASVTVHAPGADLRVLT